MNQRYDFDKKKFYLGKLCPRGHEYKNTGKSLLYKKKQYCVVCRKDSDKKLYQENAERIKQRQNEYRLKNKDKIKKSDAIYREKNKEKYKKYSAIAYEKRQTQKRLLRKKECLKKEKFYFENKDRIDQINKFCQIIRTIKNRKASREYYIENKEKIKNKSLIAQRKCISDLGDSYVKKKIIITTFIKNSNEITNSLIELKREQLLFNRLIRSMKNGSY